MTTNYNRTWPGNAEPMPPQMIDAYLTMDITYDDLCRNECWDCGEPTETLRPDCNGHKPALKYAPYCGDCQGARIEDGLRVMHEAQI